MKLKRLRCYIVALYLFPFQFHFRFALYYCRQSNCTYPAGESLWDSRKDACGHDAANFQ